MRQTKMRVFWKTDTCVSPYKGMLAVLPLCAATFLVAVVPTIVVVVLSFTNFEGVFEITKFVGVENYINLGRVIGPDVLGSMWVTLKYSFFVIIPMQVIAMLAALAVNRKLFGLSNFFRAVFFFPNILGVTVVTATWNMMYSTAGGAVYHLFQTLGIESAMLGDPKLALWLVSVMAVWAGFGFSMAIYLAGLSGISKDYYEAAKIDGASSVRQFFRITLPLIVPSVTICVWTSLNTTLHVSDYIFLTTQGGADTTTLGYYIFDRIVNNKITQGMSSVVSLVFFVFVSVIMMTVNKLFRRLEVDL